MEESTKIFCIGLNKTGTSSLHEAFKILGMKSVHYEEENGNNIKNLIADNHEKAHNLLRGIEQYDAYSDWNYPSTNILFKELDKQYPNSKFILNTRNMEDWIVSREKHVMRTPNIEELQKNHPDNPWYNIDKNVWKAEYIEHHRNVYEYFKNRENDLLVFDVTKGDEWVKLCHFLNVKIPESAFPKSNIAPSIPVRRRIRSKFKSIIKKVIGNHT